MKRLLLCGLLLTWTLAAADVSGIWNGKGGQPSAKYGSVPVPLQFTLLQAGNNVTGTIKVGNSKPVAISSGTVSGTTLALSVTSSTGSVGTANLTVAGTQLTGQMTSSTGEVFSIAVTKQ